jgi:arylsulfatase A
MTSARFAALTAAVAFLLPAAARAADKPNIVVILADDFGYGSLGCYGGPADLKTPNLDRLAREGRKFTNAYAPGSVCSPTRYALMTGRYYWRTAVKDGTVLSAGDPLHIEADRLTLASLCKGQGYRTAAFGKWHLGMTAGRVTDWSGELKPGPLEVGFDHFFGMGGNPWGGPHSFIEDRRVLGRVPGKPVVVSGNREDATTSGIEKPWDYDRITETLTDRAVGWIEKNHMGPFLVYFAHTAVHRPVAPNPAFKGKSRYGIYGDFIEELDGSVGKVLDALDRLKVADNTLVVFTSDNGGVTATTAEHGVAQKAGLKVNGPLREGKHSIYEGGFREPFLVRWPSKVPAGTVSDQVVCLTDVLATVAGVLGVPLKPGQAEDSFDAREALLGNPAKPMRDHVVLQDARATYAVRVGDWKLVERVGTPKVAPRNKNAEKKAANAKKNAPDHDELYDLAADPGESKDVGAAHPEVVAKLRKLLADARDRGHTRPGSK